MTRVTTSTLVASGVILGGLLLVVSFIVMTNEIMLFRATTQDMDFTGLVCGTPLDHPDWPRGHPCDGTMNRQFVVGALIALWGIGLIAASIVTGIIRRSKETPTQATPNA